MTGVITASELQWRASTDLKPMMGHSLQMLHLAWCLAVSAAATRCRTGSHTIDWGSRRIQSRNMAASSSGLLLACTETDKKTLMVCKKWKIFTQTFTMAPYLSLCSRINLRAFCFSCRPIWFKIWNLNVLLDFRDPEDNDSQALYSDWTLNLILSKTSQRSKTFNSRKEIRHFWLNAKLTDPLAQIVSGASNMD